MKQDSLLYFQARIAELRREGAAVAKVKTKNGVKTVWLFKDYIDVMSKTGDCETFRTDEAAAAYIYAQCTTGMGSD
jgi:hypothetical protein